MHPVPRSPHGRVLMVLVAALVLTVTLCVVCTIGSVLGGHGDTITPVPTLTASPTTATPSTPSTISPVPDAVMPNVVGLTAAVAVDHLLQVGITNVTLGSVDPAVSLVIMPENWTVARQSIPAGKPVPAGTLVVLGCRKANQ